MRQETWKIMLACAIGAGLGSFVALEVNNAFWWVGLIVGGLTGYLSYEWRAVLHAMPAAWRAARSYTSTANFWPMFFLGTMAAWCFAIDILASIGLTFIMLTMVLFTNETGILLTSELLTIFIILISVSAVLALYYGFIDAGTKDRRDALWHNAASARRTLCIVFPPILFCWHLPLLVLRLAIEFTKALYTVVTALPLFARFLSRFGWGLFLRIHSEMRLLCGVDAMLGAAVGYFAGSSLVGAAAGGIFGFINYALVTELWLKRRGYPPIHF